MTPVEFMALIIAVVAAVKLVVVLSNPRSWLEVIKNVYGNPGITSVVAFILALLALRYLLVELTIVQIFAVMFFFVLLMLIGIAPFGKEIVAFAQKIYVQKNIVGRAWLPIVVWILLLLWVFSELL